MAANVTCTVTGTLVNGAGAAVTSALVTAQRLNTESRVSATMNTADIITATSNSSTGIFSLALKAYDIMPVTYKITLPDKQYIYLRLPSNALSTGLGRILCGTSPAKTVQNISSQFAEGKFIGQNLASATALPEPSCDYHTVTGTTTITSITATNFPVGKRLVLTFAGVLTFTDGGNLSLAGNYTTSANDSIELYFDGSNFLELNRSGAV